MPSIFDSPKLAPYEVRARELLAEKRYQDLLDWAVGRRCACLGARNGDPACPCQMRSAAARKVVPLVKLRRMKHDEKPRPGVS